VLQEAITYAKSNNKPIHMLGLLSDGGVHVHINHIKGFLDVFKAECLKNIYLHAFTDGRDVDQQSGAGFIQAVEQHMQQTTGKIASVIGRYFAMDRDQRWDRVKKAYDLLVYGSGSETNDFTASLNASYLDGTTDEFIEPLVAPNKEGRINAGDVVLFFNFRTDRGR
jgi:2,3-bisphosphoglycerate-independent phosphoglycerate mutase